MVRDQEDEYSYRIRDMGGRLLQAADVYSTYYSRSSLKSLFRQYYQYGLWKVRVAQMHPRRIRLRHLIPLAFVVTLGLSALFSPLTRSAQIIFLTVAGVYLMANIGVSATLAGKKGLRHMFVVSVAFAALHVGYGAGFLVGAVKFFRRKGGPEV